MNLIGVWTVDKSDARALADLGNVVLEFLEDGQLNYSVHTDKRSQLMQLRYKIDGAHIITDQPSAPKQERTAYSISSGGILTLAFNGIPYCFIRQ